MIVPAAGFLCDKEVCIYLGWYLNQDVGTKYVHAITYVLCHAIFQEVRVSFGTNNVQVPEDIGQFMLQLRGDGIYTTPFRVSVRCLEVNPREAVGVYV